MERVERKHQAIKLILSRIALASPDVIDRWIINFCIFLSNIISGNELASLSEQARGYTLSSVGTRMLKVPQKLLEAPKDLMTQRSLQRFLGTKAVAPVAVKLHPPDTLSIIMIKDHSLLAAYQSTPVQPLMYRQCTGGVPSQ